MAAGRSPWQPIAVAPGAVADEPRGLFDRYPSQRVPWSDPATPVQLKHGLTQVGRFWMVRRG
jgi:hypothetical protein